MTPETSGPIQGIAGIFFLFASIAALIIAWRVEKRATERFREQQQDAAKIAAINVKPVLNIITAEYADLKSITLRNYGLGPAVITRITIREEWQKRQKYCGLI